MEINHKVNYRLSGLIMLLLSVNGCCVINYYSGGQLADDPELALKGLSQDAKDLIAWAYKPYDKKNQTVTDHHVHIIGAGNLSKDKKNHDEEPSTYLNENRFSCLNPKLYFLTRGLMSSSKIESKYEADADYKKRILKLARSIKHKTTFHLLALDWYWEKIKNEGKTDTYRINRENTDLYISNEHAIELAEDLNEQLEKDNYKSRFKPVISVHPYNPDMENDIKTYRAMLDAGNKGVKGFVKWLPNVMNINPEHDDHDFDAFYGAMKENNMVLLSHTGWEEAVNVHVEDHQRYGFPGFIENALDAGVTVVLAHSGGGDELKICCRKSHQSFMDLMEKASKNPGWDLYGDISNLTKPDNIDHLFDIIGNENLKYRMLYGSDYPLPAAYIHYPVNALIKKGYLDKCFKKPMKEIYRYNPLVFDFVLKRNIKHPRTGEKLPYEVFLSLEENMELAKKRIKGALKN